MPDTPPTRIALPCLLALLFGACGGAEQLTDPPNNGGLDVGALPLPDYGPPIPGTDGTDSTDGTDPRQTDPTTETTDQTEATDTIPRTTDATETTEASTETTDATEPVECVSPDDCPNPEGICQVAICTAGSCEVDDDDDGTACDDGDQCKSNAACAGGACVGAPIACSDGDPCTDDLCEPASGCVYKPIPGCCEPSCAGKACGDDGCGGSCGACGPSEACEAGACVCQADCAGKGCGPDGCGGTCGICGPGLTCSGAGQCACEPDCGGKSCGDDGCGGSCGACAADQSCTAAGLCVCEPDCAGKACGGDGCGGSCGVCPGGTSCQSGLCQCDPDCAGKACGGDGCGGSCGSCAAGSSCSGGQCESDVALGDTCETAFGIGGLPYTVLGDTSDATSDYGYASGECPGEPIGWGAGSKDEAYQFTPPQTGPYTFTLNAGYDSNLYVVTACDNIAASCLAADEEIGTGKEEVVHLSLVKGGSYWIIVDGYGNTTDQSGGYTLTVAKCTPSCGGKVCGDDGCGSTCGTCAGDTICSAGACIPAGETCEVPLVVGSLPWSTSGSTADAEPDYGYGADTCEGETSAYGATSKDEVYVFDPPSSGMYTITLDPEYDSNLYVVTSCTDVDGTCLGADEQIGTGKVETLNLDLKSYKTYFIIVDGWGNSGYDANGAYTLSVTKDD